MIRVLIADDSEDTAEMFARFLESHGYDCRVALGGEAALELFGREKFDLITVDLLMPEITGYEVAERLRRRDRLTPILLITGKEDDVLVTPHAQHAGINAVLYKPIDPPVLLAKVRELTAGKAAHGTG
jgi:DNA-binding response OmpR family regulator